MADLTSRTLGPLIAFVIPGFVALWGASFVYEPIRIWLVGASAAGPSASGALYVLLASIGAGMVASAIRWALIDSYHHATGLPAPTLDFSHLDSKLAAFYAVVDNHYRYYQFYATMLIASLFAYCVWRWGHAAPLALDVCVLAIEAVLLIASRDALRKYYERAGALLGNSASRSS